MTFPAMTPPDWLLAAWHQARRAGASDLHLVSGQLPCMRVHGRLQTLALPPCPPPPWPYPDTACLLYTSPSPRDVEESRMPSSA